MFNLATPLCGDFVLDPVFVSPAFIVCLKFVGMVVFLSLNLVMQRFVVIYDCGISWSCSC